MLNVHRVLFPPRNTDARACITGEVDLTHASVLQNRSPQPVNILNLWPWFTSAGVHDVRGHGGRRRRVYGDDRQQDGQEPQEVSHQEHHQEGAQGQGVCMRSDQISPYSRLDCVARRPLSWVFLPSSWVMEAHISRTRTTLNTYQYQRGHDMILCTALLHRDYQALVQGVVGWDRMKNVQTRASCALFPVESTAASLG